MNHRPSAEFPAANPAGDNRTPDATRRVAEKARARLLFSRHANDCALLAYGLSVVLGLSLNQCKTIAQAAWLHDIGELMLAREPWTDSPQVSATQSDGHRNHTRLGARLIADEAQRLGAGAALFADVAMYHHERWDGSGYPFALSEERIPFAARIVAVVDHYQDLIRNGSEPALSTEARALRRIEQLRGTLFDPRCVNALVSCLGYDLLGKLTQFSSLFGQGFGAERPLVDLIVMALARQDQAKPTPTPTSTPTPPRPTVAVVAEMNRSGAARVRMPAGTAIGEAHDA